MNSAEKSNMLLFAVFLCKSFIEYTLPKSFKFLDSHLLRHIKWGKKTAQGQFQKKSGQ